MEPQQDTSLRQERYVVLAVLLTLLFLRMLPGMLLDYLLRKTRVE